MLPSQGQIRGRRYGTVPQVPQGQLATSISRSQTPAFLKSWGCFWRDVWKSSIYCLLTVDLRTLKCQVLASGHVGFVSPHTDGWWDHLHWIIPLVCEQFSKWWIHWNYCSASAGYFYKIALSSHLLGVQSSIRKHIWSKKSVLNLGLYHPLLSLLQTVILSTDTLQSRQL